MKFSRLTVAVGVVLTTAFLFSGCNSGPDRPITEQITQEDAITADDVGQNTDPIETAADNRPPVASRPAATSPRKAFELLRIAVNELDHDLQWRMLDSSTQDHWNEQAGELKMRVINSHPEPLAKDQTLLKMLNVKTEDVMKVTGKKIFTGVLDLAAKENPERFGMLGKTRFHHQVTTDDKAQVFYAIRGQLADEPITFVREGSVWRRVDLRGRRER